MEAKAAAAAAGATEAPATLPVRRFEIPAGPLGAGMIANGDTEISGKLPINTDGGLIANGEPIGASGLRQIYEVCLQLRGDAGARQVPNNPRVGYTQVYGAPGTGACTVLTT